MTSIFDPLISISRRAITTDDAMEIVSILHSETNDSMVAILGATLTENALAQAVKSRLRESKTDHGELFRSSGPLSNFSALIQMGFALRIFGNEYRHDLEAIRHIRNAFAHAPRKLKFETKEVSEVCDTLKALLVAPKLNETPTTPRDKYSFTVRTVSTFLIFVSQEKVPPPANQLP